MSNEEILKLILEKTDQTTERLNNIDITLAKQSAILDEHIRRTHALEMKVGAQEVQIQQAVQHTHWAEGIIKLLGFVAVLIGIGVGLTHIYRFFA